MLCMKSTEIYGLQIGIGICHLPNGMMLLQIAYQIQTYSQFIRISVLNIQVVGSQLSVVKELMKCDTSQN